MTLLPPHQADRMILPARPATHPAGAALVSAMAHVALLAMALTLVVTPPPAPPDAVSFPLLFSAPATTILSARALAPDPSFQAVQAQVLHAVRLSEAVAAPPRTAAPPALPSPRAEAHAARPRPVQTPAPPAAPVAGGSDDGAVMVRFASDIEIAVQAAAAMPRAAVRQHREGRTEIRFAYLDGQVESVAVARSSGSRLLDDAAVAAVRLAHYPPPPASLRGRRLPLPVWVDFRIQPPAPG
jgi:protein TonB